MSAGYNNGIMANILLGVTGSVAAIRTPLLFASLRERGHMVRIVATRAATYFFDVAAIAGTPRSSEIVVLDEDEWPNECYQRNDPVTHIELRRWADLFLIAPLDANTLAKLAHGLCDNCLTCVWRAWDPARPVVLAPAMNTLMWQHPLTAQHLGALASQAGIAAPPADSSAIIDAINRSQVRRIVPPQVKELACGDVGIGAMAEVETIVGMTDSLIRR